MAKVDVIEKMTCPKDIKGIRNVTTKKRHIRDILGRTIFLCHTYDTSMTIIVTKPGIIIDVVGSYFYDKKS